MTCIGSLTEESQLCSLRSHVCLLLILFISVFNNLLPTFMKLVTYIYIKIMSYTALQGRKSHRIHLI
jgi:hypothetical protein